MKNLSQDDLIDYIKPILKTQGFKKKGKRWIKTLDDFTLVFYIQGSIYDKETYYIRPGVFMNYCPKEPLFSYGHFYTEITITDPEDILSKAEEFFSEWSNKDLIRRRVKEFIDWEKRNPVEKRRAGLVDYEKDPVPSGVCFSIEENVIDYIINCL